MARKCSSVQLGYEDEAITDTYNQQLDFSNDKFGGKPDWPKGVNLKNPICKLCGLNMPLILQLYAPIENVNHRVLYIFACINSNCWNYKDSWVCLRMNVSLNSNDVLVRTDDNKTQNSNVNNWCDGADEWEDEQNGNTIDILNQSFDAQSSDEDTDVNFSMANLNFGEKNANREVGYLSGAQGGATGRLLSPIATAEIEGEESEVMTVESPHSAQVNIVSLFEQATSVPNCASEIYFAPYFISFGEEEKLPTQSPLNEEHVKDLLTGYQQYALVSDQNSSNRETDLESIENYEKSIPAHGDKMFHTFISRLQSNPGQILRYCWDNGRPLFLYPPNDLPRRCKYCQGELKFELQLLSTIIPSLLLIASTNVEQSGHLEFGSVFLFSCKRSCWKIGDLFKEEHIVVQMEK